MNDTIYRQDAIDALKALAVPLHLDSACEDIWERDRTLDNAIDVMRNLPSAQPEIIRCKNCRNNHWCNIQEAAMAGDNFFCGAAERKTDE